MERDVLITFSLVRMNNKAKCSNSQSGHALKPRSARWLLLLAWVGMFVSAVVCGAAETDNKPSHPESGFNPLAGNPSSSAGVLKPSSNDSKPTAPDAQTLAGRSAAEVEAALGKPAGKLQTAQGALWLYPEWRVQFDQKSQVLKVEKDQPMRLARLDPQFVASADAVATAAAARAAVDDAARVKAALPPVDAVRIISNGGQEVDLPPLLAEDKITIVDFFAEWCGPCRQISPRLEQLAREDPDVVLLKVDIVNWNTPVTKQFGINSVPNVRVFNRSKAQVGDAADDVNLVMERVKLAKGS